MQTLNVRCSCYRLIHSPTNEPDRNYIYMHATFPSIFQTEVWYLWGAVCKCHFSFSTALRRYKYPEKWRHLKRLFLRQRWCHWLIWLNVNCCTCCVPVPVFSINICLGGLFSRSDEEEEVAWNIWRCCDFRIRLSTSLTVILCLMCHLGKFGLCCP